MDVYVCTCRSQREAGCVSVAVRSTALREGLTEQKLTVLLGLLAGHRAPMTHLSVSPDYSQCPSASKAGAIVMYHHAQLFWKWVLGFRIRSLSTFPAEPSPQAHVSFNDNSSNLRRKQPVLDSCSKYALLTCTHFDVTEHAMWSINLTACFFLNCSSESIGSILVLSPWFGPSKLLSLSAFSCSWSELSTESWRG